MEEYAMNNPAIETVKRLSDRCDQLEAQKAELLAALKSVLPVIDEISNPENSTIKSFIQTQEALLSGVLAGHLRALINKVEGQ